MQPENRHYLPAKMQDRALRVLLIGCGGNGAQMLMGLASLDTALREISSRSLDVTVVDDDTVTPCSAETAYARRPTRTYQLPGSVAATIPPLALPNNNELPSFLVDTDSDEATGCSDDALPGTADDWRGTEVHPDGCTCPDCVGYGP